MSDSDRGAYAPPTDAPLSFDARQPVRGSRPAPLTLIISAIVLVLLIGAIIVFYRSGVRQAGQPPQTVGTPMGAIKGAAPAEAQPADPAAGLQIYQSEQGRTVTTAPSFTPPPEAPAARPVPAAPTVATVLPPAAPAPRATVPTQSTALKPAIAAPTPPKAAQITPTLPKAPAADPIGAKLAAAPKAAPAPKPAAPAPVAAAAGGAAAVQIGAFSSQAQADSGWSDAVKLGAPGKGKKVEAIQKGGATLYRTQVTGFASKADATTFCNKLKAAGKSCFVK
jgi:cell division protein FtsN